MNFPRAPVLHGRDAELATVTAALATLGRSRGQVLLVEGPRGIGKTALLAGAAAMAEHAGVRVLFGEAYETQQTVPFAPLLPALSSGELPVVDADVARQLAEATDVRYWVVHDLHSALELAAARSPLAVVIDDLQWSDNGTLIALRSLAAGLAQLPILWLFATRTGRRRPAVTECLTRLERDGAVRVEIGALGPDAIAAIIGDLLRTGAHDTLTALAGRARGNPFLLVELLRGLREEGRLRVVEGRAAVDGEGLPRRLTLSMADRLAELPPDARQIIRVAAVLSPRFSADDLAAVLRLPPSALVVPLEETLEADLLAEDGERLRFRHDLLRQAVVETLPRSLRRAMRREAVTVLLEMGATPREIALQLAESAEEGDRAAVAALREAAQSIAGSDAVVAADLSARALDLLPPGDADRGPLVAETVVPLHQAMRSDEARVLADTALAELLPPHEEAEVRLRLFSMTTRPTLARAEENRRALRLPDLTQSARGRHLAWLAYNLSMGVDVAAATAAAESALAEAAATADLETRVMAGVSLACVDCARGACTRALTRMKDLRQLTHAEDRAPFAAVLAFHHAHTLALLGRLDEARVMVVGGVSHGRAERDALLLPTRTQFRGLLSLAAGQLSDARAEVGAVPAEEESQAENFAGIVRMVALCQLGAHTGDTATQRAGSAAARRVGTGSGPAVRRLANRLLAGTETRRGNPVNAVRLLTDDPLAAATPLVPNDLGYHPWVAGAARAAGDVELAERAAAAAESFERLNPGAFLLAGVAAHTRGLAAGDSALLIEATRLLAQTQRPLLFAAAAEDSGRALAERGRMPPALEHLNAAFDTYAAHGATADARRVGRLLWRHGTARRVGVERPRTGWASLTDSELKVVRIIATGATNRSAAEQLYLSPHTVSSHLRSAFTKLGINSRVQLARVVQDAET